MTKTCLTYKDKADKNFPPKLHLHFKLSLTWEYIYRLAMEHSPMVFLFSVLTILKTLGPGGGR